MKTTQKLTLEIRRLNEKLDQLSNRSRYLIYSANPFKFALYNFIAGVFHSLGSLFGTVIIAGILVYFASQINLTESLNRWLTDLFSTIDWHQIIPKIETNNPLR